MRELTAKPQKQILVTVAFDAAAGIWFVEDSELPGLHAEADTLGELSDIIADAAPDLIEANLGVKTGSAARSKIARAQAEIDAGKCIAADAAYFKSLKEQRSRRHSVSLVYSSGSRI